jgi:hypothetical protein
MLINVKEFLRVEARWIGKLGLKIEASLKSWTFSKTLTFNTKNIAKH